MTKKQKKFSVRARESGQNHRLVSISGKLKSNAQAEISAIHHPPHEIR
jgi:hypothetical protein